MESCEKKFLYEASTPGLLYLTLDNHKPFYVGFNSKIKLEICLVQNQGQIDKRDTLRKIEWMPHDEAKTLSETFKRESSEVSDSLQENGESDFDDSDNDLSNSEGLGVSNDTPEMPASVPRQNITSQVDKQMPSFKDEIEGDWLANVTSSEMSTKKTESASMNVTSSELSGKKTELAPGKVQGSHVQNQMLKTNSTGEGEDDEDKTKDSQGTITCEYCRTKFNTKKEYFKHRLKRPEKFYSCSKCELKFPLRAYLLVHMRIHEGRKDFSCKQCGAKSKNETSLKMHMIRHTGEHVFKCCVCGKTFPHNCKWNSHMPTHRPPGSTKCSCCNQFFPTRAAFAAHKLATEEIKCGLCGQVFPNTASRTLHFKSEHGDTILRCHICNGMYSTQKELDEHIAKHGRYKKKQCPVCGRMVTNLPNHILSHKKLEEMDEADLFMCDKCPNKFKTKKTLLDHVRRHHRAERSKCHLCPQTFSSMNGLQRHLNSVHSNLWPYQCEVCGKRCKVKYNLKVHMRTHSATKTFPCSLCSQAFNYKSSLDAHMRSKHSSEAGPVTSGSSAGQSHAPAPREPVVSETNSHIDPSTSGLPVWFEMQQGLHAMTHMSHTASQNFYDYYGQPHM